MQIHNHQSSSIESANLLQVAIFLACGMVFFAAGLFVFYGMFTANPAVINLHVKLGLPASLGWVLGTVAVFGGVAVAASGVILLRRSELADSPGK